MPSSHGGSRWFESSCAQRPLRVALCLGRTGRPVRTEGARPSWPRVQIQLCPNMGSRARHKPDPPLSATRRRPRLRDPQDVGSADEGWMPKSASPDSWLLRAFGLPSGGPGSGRSRTTIFALLRKLPLRGTRLWFAARLRLAEGPGPGRSRTHPSPQPDAGFGFASPDSGLLRAFGLLRVGPRAKTKNGLYHQRVSLRPSIR